MPIESTIRTRRPSAAVFALQSVKGTPVDDLRIVSGGVRVWTQKIDVSASKGRNNPRWMTEKFADNQSSRVNIRDNAEGRIVAVATPDSLSKILQNNWGQMAGVPQVSTLSSSIYKYATLAWIESTATGSTQKLVRLSDAFLYKLKLSLDRTDGKLLMIADYVARKNENVPLNSLGGIQITPAPMTPSDVRVYNVRNATFIREPSGVNVSLDFIELEITLDQQVNSEWTYTDKWDVRKRGKTAVYVHFRARLSDEFWAILSQSNAGAKERFRITATSDGSPVSTLTVDLFSLDWQFENIGHDESAGCLVEATARAFLVAQTPETGFCKFTIS